MADLAFLEAKIVCGGAWGNDKMVWGFFCGRGERWWGGAVAHYWCLALGGRRGRGEGKSAVAHYWYLAWGKGGGEGKVGVGIFRGKKFGGRGFIIGGNVVTLW